MASLPPVEKVEFLLAILGSAGAFKPNYHIVATKLGIKDAHDAQRKFKTLVEAGDKYILNHSKEGYKVIATTSASPTPAAAAAAAPPTSNVTTKSTKAAKPKRKRAKDDDEDDDGNFSDHGKAKGKTQGKKAKKGGVSKKIKHEDNDDEGAAGGAAVAAGGVGEEV